jgi:ABC-type nitrate/sulfonate/bicarbonate transport system substrate-binding protein
LIRLSRQSSSRRGIIQTIMAGIAGAIIGSAGTYLAGLGREATSRTITTTVTAPITKEKPKEKITIGIGTLTKELPWFKAELAIRMLKEAGYDVELVYLTPRAVREAFLARKSQIASISAPVIYGLMEQGHDIITAPHTGAVELVLVANENYPDPRSLEGKRVGIGLIGAYEYAALNAYLRERNINVELIQIGESKERANALLGGKIDAAGLILKDALALIEQGAPVKIIDSLHVFWVINWVYRDWAEQNSGFMIDYYRAQILAGQWALNNRDRFIDEAMEWMGLEQSEENRKKQEKIYEWLRDLGVFYYTFAPIDEYETLMKWTLESGDIKSEIPLEKIFDLPNKFLEKAFDGMKPT